MTKTQSERDWSLMLKREMDLIKREDKLENVQRITKANEYKKGKILEKIEFGNMKGEHIRKEKGKLMETRFAVRKEADKQKQTIMNAFESLKKKGKIDNTSLQRLGLDIQIKEDPNEEDNADAAGRGDTNMDQTKARQNKEMMALLEQEKQNEKNRAENIQITKNDDEKQLLIKQSDQAKAQASDKIVKLKN